MHISKLTWSTFYISIVDELADLAGHSESDSVRDECSSGVRSEGEEDPPRRTGTLSWEDERRGGVGGAAQLGSSSTLSSCSTTSQARLIQSSLRETQPPVPPPRTSSAVTEAPPPPTSDLGKRSTCMQCYLSGHSDGSIDSVEPSTEGSSSVGTPRDPNPPDPLQPMVPIPRDGDSGIGQDMIQSCLSAGIRNSESRDSGIGTRELLPTNFNPESRDNFPNSSGLESRDSIQSSSGPDSQDYIPNSSKDMIPFVPAPTGSGVSIRSLGVSESRESIPNSLGLGIELLDSGDEIIVYREPNPDDITVSTNEFI